MKKTAVLLLLIASMTARHVAGQTPLKIRRGPQIISGTQLSPQDSALQIKWALLARLIPMDHSQKTVALLDSLTTVARKQGRRDYLLKAALYRLVLQRASKDESTTEGLPRLDSLIHSAGDSVEKSVLLVIKAHLFAQIYSNDRYKINGRTRIMDTGGLPDPSKVDAWTQADFFAMVHALYQEALQPAEILQQTPSVDFSAIVTGGDTTRPTPTMYELLIKDALDLWGSAVMGNLPTEHPFTLSDPALLSEAATFATYPFAGPDDSDSLNSKWLMLKLYQQLVAFKVKAVQQRQGPAGRAALASLAETDLDRLEWLQAQLPDDFAQVADAGEKDLSKQTLIRTALERAIADYKGTEGGLYAGYLLAQSYAEQANLYRAGVAGNTDTAHRYDNVKALAVIARFDRELDQARQGATGRLEIPLSSAAAANLLNLRNQLLRGSLSLRLPAFNVPDQPIPALLSFENIKTVYFRILKIPVRPVMLSFTEDFWLDLLSRRPMQSFSQEVPQTGDYQTHAAEIKIPALQRGNYILLASSDPRFSKDSCLIAASFGVTNVTFMSHGQDMFLVNRATGKPLAEAQVDVFDYVSKGGISGYELGFSTVSDATGRVRLKKGFDNYSDLICAVYGADTLISNFPRYAYYNSDYGYDEDDEDDDEDDVELVYYLDRSIYRPGQQVQFKAIATVPPYGKNARKLWTDHKEHKVLLVDGQGKTLDSVTLRLTEFGALQGTLTIPEGHLPGRYSLRCEDFNNRTYFQVEQYKRPTYFVTLDTLKDAVAVGDSVTIHGKAMAYSGYPITGATVVINVDRQVYFPYMWYGYLPSVPQQAVAHGEVRTDDQGAFSFTFKAAPGGGSTGWLRYMPNYRFSVKAECTDPSGETRTSNQQLVIGSQPFGLRLELPGSALHQLDSLAVFSETASGQFTAQPVQLKITRLKAPDRLLRNRFWSTPDLAVMDSATFAGLFPHDPYMGEDDKDHWAREAVVYEKEIMTTSKGKLALDKAVGPGWYEVIVSAPGLHGLTIKDKQYVSIYNDESPLLSPTYNWSRRGVTSVLPGEKTGLRLASSLKDQYVWYTTTRAPKSGDIKGAVTYGHLTLAGVPVEIPVTLSKNDRYGVQVDYSFVRDNRQYSGSMRVQLKDTTTAPKIVYEHFRDKTEPGSKERWTLHIQKGENRMPQMELLSAMYDASLDQFMPHHWWLPAKWDNRSLQVANWQSLQQFMATTELTHRVYHPVYSAVQQKPRMIISDWLNNGNRVFAPEHSSSMLVRGRVAGLAVNAASPQLDEVAVVGYSNTQKRSITGAVTVREEKDLDMDGSPDVQDGSEPSAYPPVRSDFRETAFFFPSVRSDDKGNYSIDFQMPGAVTTWKWMNLGYDKQLNMVSGVQQIVSQKTLMVMGHLPRFVRNGDRVQLPARVVNLSESPMTSSVTIDIKDPATGESLAWASGSRQSVQLAASSNATVYFDLSIPDDFTGPVELTLRASGGAYSDAEKNILPVITNQIRVTETQPIYMDSDGATRVTLDKLSKAGANTTHNKLVFELTTNPIWNVVVALPEIKSGNNPSGMDVIQQLYADGIGRYVMARYPKIRQVLMDWTRQAAAQEDRESPLRSALSKNPDLKSVLLDQTPWVMEAESETVRHQALARFFDGRRMDSLQRSLVSKLLSLQQTDGGFSWFSGGRSNALTTQWILMGIAELTNGKLKDQSLIVPLTEIADKAARYLNEFYMVRYRQWQQRIKDEKSRLQQHPEQLSRLDTSYHLSGLEINYLYALSLLEEPASFNEMQRFFLDQQTHQWRNQSTYLKLLMAATELQVGNRDFAVDSLLTGALNTTVDNPALGRYWKRSTGYYSWFENPLQAQALAIRLLARVGRSDEGFARHPEWTGYLAAMQRYLISQKQTNHWSATKTTVDACLAMIEAAPDAFKADRKISVQLGGKTLDLQQQDQTGYVRYEVAGKDITPDMGQLTLMVTGMKDPNPVPVYGALYWQYLSPIKEVEAAEQTAGISMEKGLYREINTDAGRQLVPVKAGEELRVGDKLISRLVFSLDRDMDYVHLREMRAAGVQPDQNISGYQYQDGLAYYQAISDLATDLYFDHINKGSHVIEYPVHVSHGGSFAAGTATMESFYAPEFSTHTEGIRIQARQAE